MRKHPDVPYQLIRSIKVRARRTNRTPIFVAVQENIIVALPHLVTQTNINSRNDQGATPLAEAAARGHADVVQFLLTLGADYELEDNAGLQAIDRAATAGFDLVVSMLINHEMLKHPDIPRQLIRAINVRARCTHTEPIFVAAQDGIVEALPYVVTLDNINVRNAQGITPLAAAAEHGHAHVVHFLLEHGANSELEDSSGLQAIDKAEVGGFQNVVSLLIEHEMRKHPDVPYKLIREIKTRAKSTNRAPIFIAAQEGILEALSHFVTPQNVNERNAQGITPLAAAAASDHADVVHVLLAHGAEPTLENTQGLRAIDIADAAGFRKVVEVLVAHNFHMRGLDKTILVPAAEPVAPAPTTGQTVECQLCLENKHDIVTLTCTHQYCRTCLSAMVTLAIQEHQSRRSGARILIVVEGN